MSHLLVTLTAWYFPTEIPCIQWRTWGMGYGIWSNVSHVLTTLSSIAPSCLTSQTLPFCSTNRFFKYQAKGRIIYSDWCSTDGKDLANLVPRFSYNTLCSSYPAIPFPTSITVTFPPSLLLSQTRSKHWWWRSIRQFAPLQLPQSTSLST